MFVFLWKNETVVSNRQPGATESFALKITKLNCMWTVIFAIKLGDTTTANLNTASNDPNT